MILICFGVFGDAHLDGWIVFGNSYVASRQGYQEIESEKCEMEEKQTAGESPMFSHVNISRIFPVSCTTEC